MEGFLWCPHCAAPHGMESRFCPATGKAIRLTKASETRAERIGVGTLVDKKYYIAGVIGSGGQSIVFEALHVALVTRVAIKFLRKPHPRALERFEQEARLAASITHPNVCRCFDMGKLESGTRYIVMERLQGASLSRILKEKRLGPSMAIHLVGQVLSGLATAHAASIVHRDIKPGNVFVEMLPAMDPNAKILDFGFAKDLSAQSSVKTTMGRQVGTPAYISPEQLDGSVATAQSDLFSTGVLLYEILAGRRPFVGKTPSELATAILRDEPPPPRTLGLPAALDGILARALAKHPKRRYATAAEFREALQGLSVRTERRRAISWDNIPSLTQDEDESS